MARRRPKKDGDEVGEGKERVGLVGFEPLSSIALQSSWGGTSIPPSVCLTDEGDVPSVCVMDSGKELDPPTLTGPSHVKKKSSGYPCKGYKEQPPGKPKVQTADVCSGTEDSSSSESPTEKRAPCDSSDEFALDTNPPDTSSEESFFTKPPKKTYKKPAEESSDISSGEPPKKICKKPARQQKNKPELDVSSGETPPKTTPKKPTVPKPPDQSTDVTTDQTPPKKTTKKPPDESSDLSSGETPPKRPTKTTKPPDESTEVSSGPIPPRKTTKTPIGKPPEESTDAVSGETPPYKKPLEESSGVTSGEAQPYASSDATSGEPPTKPLSESTGEPTVDSTQGQPSSTSFESEPPPEQRAEEVVEEASEQTTEDPCEAMLKQIKPEDDLLETFGDETFAEQDEDEKFASAMKDGQEGQDYRRAPELPIMDPLILFRKSELIDYRFITHTGYFRDMIRRVDLVLVLDDSGMADVEKVKNDFLLNCMRAGLNLEIEMGMLPQNRYSVYVKLHAPNELLLALGRHYGTRKYYRDNHLELARNYVTDERSIAVSVRNLYPGPYWYSTFDRIQSVYRLLRAVPFGRLANYRGVDALVKNGVIRDMYPLHDGPYFVVESEDERLNGRQALYQTWVGYDNIANPQPLHLIREYFGERIALLFALWQFCNYKMLQLGIAGILLFAAGYYLLPLNDRIVKAACTKVSYTHPHWRSWTDYGPVVMSYTRSISVWGYVFDWRCKNSYEIAYDTYDHREMYGRELDITKLYSIYGSVKPYNVDTFTQFMFDYASRCQYTWTGVMTFKEDHLQVIGQYGRHTYTDLPVCPKCSYFKTCPFVNMTTYCSEVRRRASLDYPLSLIIALMTVFWGLWTSLKWRQKESYFYWLWETNEEYGDHMIRPEFTPFSHHLWRVYGTKALVILAVLLIYTCVAIPMLIKYAYKSERSYSYLYRNMENAIRGKLFTMPLAAAFNGLLVLAMELASNKVVFYLIQKAPSHRTERELESAVATQLFSFHLLANCGLVFYYAFVKGAMYTYPADSQRWSLPLGLGSMNCGLISCIDEVVLVLVATHFTKYCFKEFDRMQLVEHSEMMHLKWYNFKVPCWEKEGQLKPLGEAALTTRYNLIVMQVTCVAMLNAIFPFGGIAVFFYNVFDMRCECRRWLLFHRRPLLVKMWGTGAWRRPLLLMPYLVAISNIVAIARLSLLIPRSLHRRYFNNLRFFADFSMSFFNTSDFASAKGGPADEWQQYQKAPFNKHMYPHYTPAAFCMFPNQYGQRYRSHRLMQMWSHSYMPNQNYWLIMWYKLMLVIAFEQLTAILGVLMTLLVPRMTETVRTTLDIETAMRATRLRQDLMTEEQLLEVGLPPPYRPRPLPRESRELFTVKKFGEKKDA